MKPVKHLFFLLCLALFTLSASQSPVPQPAPEDLLETLTPNFVRPNRVLTTIFSPQVSVFQTPLVIRYVLFYSLSMYEISAACHPTALSFFGVRDKIDPALCHPLPRVKIFLFTLYRILTQEFPTQGQALGQFLRSVGVNPERSSDLAAEEGLAKKFALRANKYFRNDGWNSLGDLSRDQFLQPYSDYTKYKPVNLAQKPISALRRPLRWQPLVQPASNFGEFKSQVHILPHLGSVRPLALSKKHLHSRISRSPYRNPNMRNNVGKRDRAELQREISNYFKISRGLDTTQRFEAAFWENKLFSLGAFLPAYSVGREVSHFERDQWFLSEMIAQHDALIVAWREKRRHDLVRPATIIRKLLKGRSVRAFVSASLGVQAVRVEEYEPLIPAQPHSEFPSASAVICVASLESVEAAFTEKFGQNFTFPPFVLPRGSLPMQAFPVDETADLRYESPKEAANACGLSRLYAGVHFAPSVEEGLRLGEGIGRRAFEHTESLRNGRVPTGCARCL